MCEKVLGLDELMGRGWEWQERNTEGQKGKVTDVSIAAWPSMSLRRPTLSHFFKDFLSFFLREKEREEERKRTSMGCLSYTLQTGTGPTT